MTPWALDFLLPSALESVVVVSAPTYAKPSNSYVDAFAATSVMAWMAFFLSKSIDVGEDHMSLCFLRVAHGSSRVSEGNTSPRFHMCFSPFYVYYIPYFFEFEPWKHSAVGAKCLGCLIRRTIIS